jgi:hypothetical protein
MSPVLGIIASSNQQGRGGGPVGSYDSIATAIVPSGGLSSITFTGIPAGYRHLELRILVRTTNNNTYGFLIATVNGSTSGYFRHLLLADGVNNPYGAYGYTNETKLGLGYIAAATATTNNYGVVVASITDYASTTKFKTLRSNGGSSNNSSGSYYMAVNSGTYPSLDPITSIKIQDETGNLVENSHFALYGVK